jgi:hypothetical protein
LRASVQRERTRARPARVHWGNVGWKTDETAGLRAP